MEIADDIADEKTSTMPPREIVGMKKIADGDGSREIADDDRNSERGR